MNITNTYNLPLPVFRALAHESYQKHGKNEISVTSLIGPPKIRQLKLRHDEEISLDASERVWSLLGQSVHKVLELAAGEGDLSEGRLYQQDPKWNGWSLTGQHDLYQPAEATLSDFKVTSVYSFLLGEKSEWEQQLNLNAMLLRHHGHAPHKLQIIAILRDWQSSKAELDPYGYPPCALHVVNIPLWTPEKCLSYATERILLHQNAEALPDDDIPPCTPAERWAKPDSFALKKQGNKKATKVCQTLPEAQALLATLGPLFTIETRPGGDTRCERYCPVAPFCSYYKNSKNSKNNEPLPVP